MLAAPLCSRLLPGEALFASPCSMVPLHASHDGQVGILYGPVISSSSDDSISFLIVAIEAWLKT